MAPLPTSSTLRNNRPLLAHLSMFGACAGWGLMAPIGKEAMTNGVSGLAMVTFRIAGACVLFWLASLFAKHETVPWRDKLMFAGAALFGLILNQCCYTIGLSITSPINASIVTTSMPIFGSKEAAEREGHINTKVYRNTEWERDGATYGWGNNRGLVLMKSFDLVHWTCTNLDFF